MNPTPQSTDDKSSTTDSAPSPQSQPSPTDLSSRSHLPDLTLIFSTLIALGLAAVAIFSTWLYCDIQENKRIDAEAVTLVPDLSIDFGAPAKVSDFIAQLNGQLVDDITINTESLGDQTVTFEYINLKNRKRTASFTLQVRDHTAPRIIGNHNYTVTTGYTGDLTNLMLSGDDHDDRPRREILGQYDLEQPGTYQLEYSITDASQNQTKQPFTLHVVEPEPNSTPETPAEPSSINLADVIRQHKTSCTKIGIDVSSWQGGIDWSAVRDAGVEFAFIRIGYQTEYDGEYHLDARFLDNIAAANALHLPVGVYFYSYAHTPEQAQAQATWITERLNGHTAELGVAFDWENWHSFNSANMSFYTINKVARTFLDQVSHAGYPGILYSSKYYLEKIWTPTKHQTWLAQYYDRVTYDGEYQIWQMSNIGKVPGIDGDVDLDIMYLD